MTNSHFAKEACMSLVIKHVQHSYLAAGLAATLDCLNKCKLICCTGHARPTLPKNAYGHGAGEITMMQTWDDWPRMYVSQQKQQFDSDLSRHSPEEMIT